MRPLRRWIALSASERELLCEAVVESAAVSAGLCVRKVGSLKRRIAPVLLAVDVEKLAWAVRVAGRVVPRSTCLVLALAMQRMLAKRGRASELELGVARSKGALEAHAWLVCEGRVVIGGEETERFVSLGAI